MNFILFIYLCLYGLFVRGRKKVRWIPLWGCRAHFWISSYRRRSHWNSTFLELFLALDFIRFSPYFDPQMSYMEWSPALHTHLGYGRWSGRSKYVCWASSHLCGCHAPLEDKSDFRKEWQLSHWFSKIQSLTPACHILILTSQWKRIKKWRPYKAPSRRTPGTQSGWMGTAAM